MESKSGERNADKIGSDAKESRGDEREEEEREDAAALTV